MSQLGERSQILEPAVLVFISRGAFLFLYNQLWALLSGLAAGITLLRVLKGTAGSSICERLFLGAGYIDQLLPDHVGKAGPNL